MENQQVQVRKTPKEFFEQQNVKKRFEELMGKRAPQFISSVIQIISNSSLLSKADPLTVYNSALMAATLDLPVNQNLGFAWILPYGQNAQFQMGYKGYIQLAMRSGQYSAMNVTEVYENQFKHFNQLTENLEADFSIVGAGAIVGYAAYFKLLNGFEKTVYWPIEKVKAHGKRFSKSFNNGPWKSDFDAMARKTVLKNMLSSWGMLSVEMQMAVKIDQSVIKDEAGQDVEYVDHEEITPVAPVADVEDDRENALIEDMRKTTKIEDLEPYGAGLTGKMKEAYDYQHDKLTNGK